MANPQGRDGALEQARRCCAGAAWRQAVTLFVELDTQLPLDVDDLERLARSAALLDDDALVLGTWERIYQARVDAGQALAAARTAFWLGFRLMMLGEHGRGGGWIGRCQRLVDDAGDECAERGYLMLLPLNHNLMTGGLDAAAAIGAEAAAIGERFEDQDLVALARSMEGKALLRLGRLDLGMARLDASMVAVTSKEVSPVVAGIVYCSVIASCQRIYALERAREWTAALTRWCSAQPELVTFQGSCQVHRSEILQLGGDWEHALEHAERVASSETSGEARAVAADGYYQVGELHRLRGDLDAADAAYLQATQCGRDPQPGLALLRAAQGRHKTALGGIRRVLLETTDPLARVRLLPACIEIGLAAGELPEARQCCDELEAIAGQFDSDVLGAISAHVRGLVHLADGDPRAALGPLRKAFFVWQKLGAPYEEARSRVALARACRELGDAEGARTSLDAARVTFARLGAAIDLTALSAQPGTGATQGLSPRELQVLRLVATGATNKAIAATLDLSEKTIDRHVSNIFIKLDVGSRAAATAYAYEHGLI